MLQCHSLMSCCSDQLHLAAVKTNRNAAVYTAARCRVWQCWFGSGTHADLSRLQSTLRAFTSFCRELTSDLSVCSTDWLSDSSCSICKHTRTVASMDDRIFLLVDRWQPLTPAASPPAAAHSGLSCPRPGRRSMRPICPERHVPPPPLVSTHTQRTRDAVHALLPAGGDKKMYSINSFHSKLFPHL